MDSLRSAGLEGPSLEAVESGRPFLGICVGMQMLFTKSEEDAQATGLDVIPGTVRWIPPGRTNAISRFHRCNGTGCESAGSDPMFAGLGEAPFVYFVHSLHGVPDDPEAVAATVEYGTTLNAAFRAGNVFAAQFHPEKSSTPGLRMLSNFVDVCAVAEIRPDRRVMKIASEVDLYPGHRPARWAGRASAHRRLRRPDGLRRRPRRGGPRVRRRWCTVDPRGRPRRGEDG